jgi:hypothetical protein
MSLIANFDIATDLQVYLLSWEDEDAFIINHSFIGGPDVLSDTELVPKQIECVVSSADIETGFTAESPSTFSPFSGAMNLQLRGTNFDSFSNPNIILGRRIGLYIKTDIGDDVMIYSGYIQSFDFEYIPNQAVILNISATDFLYYLNGYSVDIPNAGTGVSNYTTTLAVEDILENFRAPQETVSVRVGGGGVTNWDNLVASDQLLIGNAGELIAYLMNGQQGWVFCSPGDFLASSPEAQRNELIIEGGGGGRINTFLTRDEVTIFKHGGGNVSVDRIVFDTTDESEYCPSSIAFVSDVNQLINDVRVSLTDGTQSYFVEDKESQARYGTNGVDESFQFAKTQIIVGLPFPYNRLTGWGNFALASNTLPVISNLRMPAIDRSGALQIPAIEYGIYAGLPAKVITDFNGATIDRNYIITKTRHSITADNWIIDYSLYTR